MSMPDEYAGTVAAVVDSQVIRKILIVFRQL